MKRGPLSLVRKLRHRFPLDPLASAKAVSLRYVGDSVPGIRRIVRGKGFTYRRPDGAIVRDAKVHHRIRSLVIPPVGRTFGEAAVLTFLEARLAVPRKKLEAA